MALEEVRTRMAVRFSGVSDVSRVSDTSEISDISHGDGLSPFDTDEIAAEIRLQDASKACSADGIHIRLIKILASEPTFLDALALLYNTCLTSGRTPSAWYQTLVCLLIKDESLPKDVDNVRPITLTSIVRKVFERLLLPRFDLSGWASVHTLQASFKARHSTYLNAAVLHSLLESGRISHVAFLDFRAAFDTVDHSILSAILRKRGCPARMLSLISSLTFEGISSTIVSDGDMSEPFTRSRGVLQGSPLSPHLFNIFVDGLLCKLESAGAVSVIRSTDLAASTTQTHPLASSLIPTLFYADDGTLLASSAVAIQRLLDVVTDWCLANKMELNVKKCGYLGPTSATCTPTVFGATLPYVEGYEYLGFPITRSGIDFSKHLASRLAKAVGCTSFLSLFSDGWGPTHRLRMYKTYLAPMFEYVAPLMAAFAEGHSSSDCSSFFDDPAIKDPFGDLIGWIAGSKTRVELTANLLGVEPLSRRFAGLKSLFQVNLRALSDGSPLKRLRALSWPTSSFYRRLTSDSRFDACMSDLPPTANLPHRKCSHVRSRLDREREELSRVDAKR
jgi:hypothetical protein